MISFLLFIVISCALLFSSVATIFFYNPWLNGLILGSFMCGIYIPFLQLKKSEGDLKILFSENDCDGSESILSPFLFENYEKRKKYFSLDEAQSILASVERRLGGRHSVNKYLIGVLVLLGLLGTFWGLTHTVGSIAASMEKIQAGVVGSNEAFNQLKSGIQAPLAGMGVAFSSSILGLVCSLIIGFLDLQQSKGEKIFYDCLETKLFERSKKGFDKAGSEQFSGYAYILVLLEQTVESLNSLATRIRQNEDNRIATSGMVQRIGEAMINQTAIFQKIQELTENLYNISNDVRKNLTETKDSFIYAVQANPQVKELQSIKLSCDRMLEEVVEGRKKSISEIRGEIRLIVRALSILAEPEEKDECVNA